MDLKGQLEKQLRDTATKSEESLFTREETAQYLKCDLSSVHNYTKKGKLTKYRLGARTYYKKSEIDKAIKPITMAK
jgi:hypothetical protein